MRIIKNRTFNKLSKPLRILSILRGRWDEQRSPSLQALADLGHQVVYVDKILDLDDYYKLVRKIDFDIILFWGSSLQNFLNSFPGKFFLEEINLPYISMWTDNTIKHMHLLKELNTPLHLGMFVPDTRVIEQLNSLGWDNVFYLPPWHIDPSVFKPQRPNPKINREISFAATFNPYLAEKTKWRAGWDEKMKNVGDSIVKLSRETSGHVDVFDFLDDEWDVYSTEFSEISHAMYFEQKSISREQLIIKLGDLEVEITGMGSAQSNQSNVKMGKGLEWWNLSPLFCSSTINLNLTPWPRSCHHRMFQISASGAFVLSDWKDDAVKLYEPDKEAVYFKDMNEVPDLIQYYLEADEERVKIARAGRKRFLSEHTVNHRMSELSEKLYELL